jgi:hypothetical protein
MHMPQQRRTLCSRGVTLLAVAACVLAVVVLTGCLPDRGESNPQSNADQMSPQELAAAQKQAQAEGAAADDGVMKYEEGAADPLAGDWSYTEMRVSYPSDETGKRLGPGTWAAQKEPQHFTIVKQGQGYGMDTGATGTSAVTFDGTRMTLEYSYPTNSARYSGVLNGDTIVGTQHLVLGPDVYDGSWTATRAK